jgi:CBS domain
MSKKATLVVTSLLSILLLTLHVTDDIVRGISNAEPSNIALLVLVVFLYGTLVLAEQRSGLVIMLLVGLLAFTQFDGNIGAGERHRTACLGSHSREHGVLSFPIAVALEMMGTSGYHVLPVVSRANVRRLEGIVTLEDILEAYGVSKLREQNE